MSQKLTFVDTAHVWIISCENSQRYFACAETNKKFF